MRYITLPSVLLIGLAALALLAPWISVQNPLDPREIDLANAFLPPIWTDGSKAPFWMGSDDQGRDVLSATLYGLRESMVIAAAAVALGALLGMSAGIAAGVRGGFLDSLLMRIADIQLAFPAILIALLIDGLLRTVLPRAMAPQAATPVLIVSIALATWVPFARSIRAAVQRERAKDYITAARVTGCSWSRIAWRHLLPNIAPAIGVVATASFAVAILTEATLSFLGLGVPLTRPSLGGLLNTGQHYLLSGEWWIAAFAAVVLVALIASANAVADRLASNTERRH